MFGNDKKADPRLISSKASLWTAKEGH